MAFAIDDDVADVLGRALTASEANVVDNLCEQATDLVVGYGVPDTINPVPGAVKRVVATMVAAVFNKPSLTVADYQANGYSTQLESATVKVGVDGNTTTGPWLTNALKMRLNPYRSNGMNQIGMRSESINSIDAWPQLNDLYSRDGY